MKQLARHPRRVYSAAIICITLILGVLLLFVPPQSDLLILIFNGLIAANIFCIVRLLKIPAFLAPVAFFIGALGALQSFALITPLHVGLLSALTIGLMILLR